MNCPKCHKQDPHFVPPSLGEPGFFVCETEQSRHIIASALTREQFAPLVRRLRIEGDLDGSRERIVLDNDAVLRLTLAQQAREVEWLQKQYALQKEIADNQTWHVQDLRKQLSAITTERDEMILRRSETVAMCDQLMRERNLLQHRFDDAMEAINKLQRRE